MTGTERSDLMKAYADFDIDQRIRLSRVGCVLAVSLVPLFWGLDLIIYPGSATSLLWSRIICGLGVIGVFSLLFTPFGRTWIRGLGIAWALIPGMAISWMVYVNEGERSPYYAGLNLAMIAVALLMPWNAFEVAIVCLATVLMYMASCLLHTPLGDLSWTSLTSNLYFMIATAAICVTAGFFSARRRFEDFRLRHELDQRNHQLAELDRLKTEFYANVSHELRTPLTLILAPLEQLRSQPGLDRQVRSTLKLIRDSALRLLRLINDLLDVIRMDEGQVILHRSRFNLAIWVPGIVQSIQHLAETKHLNLTCTSSASVTIDADPLMLEKVLLNLLSNAIKFTPEHGRIIVTWGTDDRQRPWLEVSDTGIGIAADELPRLFGRFHQVDGSATRRYRGLGLGLSLSRDLVQRHGGTLTATSTMGKGSTFRIELPPALPVEGGDPAPTPPAGSEDLITCLYREADREGHVINGASDGHPLGSILEPFHGPTSPDLVLVADDEPDMRRFIVDILRQRHRVVAAGDGGQAVELAHRLQPSLVILDMMMPQMDGMQVCRALRADEQLCDCRIILLTARADDETKLSALQGGADDFLSKPFNSQEVLSRVHNLLENIHLQRKLQARNRELEDALTRLGRAEAQLVQSAKMNALGSLTAGLLHEINNPLNFTRMAVQCARSRIPDSDLPTLDMFKDIHDGMTRISDIITSLRTFAYPESVSLEQSFPAAQAIDLALRFSAHLCIGIVIDHPPSACDICGSVNQISIVLVNLLDNATKAIRETTDGRAGRITITTEQRGDRCLIAVSDNGVGMDAQRIQRAFEPFFTTSPIGQGMGLGLSICHTIIANHKGDIRIDSTPGAGTTITLSLPSLSTFGEGTSHEPRP